MLKEYYQNQQKSDVLGGGLWEIKKTIFPNCEMGS